MKYKKFRELKIKQKYIKTYDMDDYVQFIDKELGDSPIKTGKITNVIKLDHTYYQLCKNGEYFNNVSKRYITKKLNAKEIEQFKMEEKTDKYNL